MAMSEERRARFGGILGRLVEMPEEEWPTVDEWEELLVTEALEFKGGVQKGAAELIGITPRKMNYKVNTVYRLEHVVQAAKGRARQAAKAAAQAQATQEAEAQGDVAGASEQAEYQPASNQNTAELGGLGEIEI